MLRFSIYYYLAEANITQLYTKNTLITLINTTTTFSGRIYGVSKNSLSQRDISHMLNKLTPKPFGSKVNALTLLKTNV